MSLPPVSRDGCGRFCIVCTHSYVGSRHGNSERITYARRGPARLCVVVVLAGKQDRPKVTAGSKTRGVTDGCLLLSNSFSFATVNQK
jgi:hypothetical protein